ncbi:MAG: aminodeoxychorismate/anthranilate synthase component II [Bacteroidales bacterium]|jgi:anthranilate synthase component 2|nr:aminodeoxychorismate/anthranilate synthase component II [Bacteroidales bacterium]
MKVLLVDNYDSFTYNIAHIVRSCHNTNLQIIKADQIDPALTGIFDKIIFSPGPDLPKAGNIMEKILESREGKTPVLGICLGLQAIYLYYGGSLKQMDEPAHGKTVVIQKNMEFSVLLSEIPNTFRAGLYHSWFADPDFLPSSLVITALSEEGRIMGIRHKKYDIEAVQFHPESIMTPLGSRMINSWLGDHPLLNNKTPVSGVISC